MHDRDSKPVKSCECRLSVVFVVATITAPLQPRSSTDYCIYKCRKVVVTRLQDCQNFNEKVMDTTTITYWWWCMHACIYPSSTRDGSAMTTGLIYIYETKHATLLIAIQMSFHIHVVLIRQIEHPNTNFVSGASWSKPRIIFLRVAEESCLIQCYIRSRCRIIGTMGSRIGFYLPSFGNL